MKASVSIPDPLFHEAEKLAKRLGMPRSQLYARALQALVRQHAPESITAQMNATLERVGTSTDPGWERLGLEVIRRGEL